MSVRQSTGSIIPEHLMSTSHGICVLVAPVINWKETADCSASVLGAQEVCSCIVMSLVFVCILHM